MTLSSVVQRLGSPLPGPGDMNLTPPSTGLGLALSMSLASLQNSEKSWGCQWSSSQRKNGRGWGAGWRLWPEPILLAVPGIWPDPGSESGPRHVRGPGPLQAPVSSGTSLKSPTRRGLERLGCGGGQTWPLSQGSRSLPKGTFFPLGKQLQAGKILCGPFLEQSQAIAQRRRACTQGDRALGRGTDKPLL